MRLAAGPRLGLTAPATAEGTTIQQNTAKRPVPVGLAAAAALALGLAACGPLEQIQKDREEQEVARGELSSVMEDMIKSDGRANVDTKARAKGNAGKMEALTRGFFARIGQDTRQMEAELKALGYPALMEPASLRADGDLKATRAKLVEVRAVVARHRKLRFQRMDEFRVAVRNSDLPERDKRDMIGGMDDSQAESGAQARRIWDIQDEILREMDAAVAVLQAAPRGAWEVQAGQLMFQRSSDMNAYNDHITRAQTLEAEQKGLQQAAATRARSRMR